jgi:hypothetical protein
MAYSIAWRSAAMKMNGHIHKILANDVSDNPGTEANLPRIPMHGKLARILGSR